MLKIFSLVGLALFIPNVLLAYNVAFHDSDQPYEVQPVQIDVIGPQYFLGELTGWPEMYEITFDATTTLMASIRAIKVAENNQADLAGLLVKDLAGHGVAEVVRLPAKEADWTKTVDPVSRLTYYQGGEIEQELPAGTYRLEISTPDNQGQYILVIGDNSQSTSYGTTLAGVAKTYDFYNQSKIGMLRAPVVFYPVGILVILGLTLLTWRWHRRRIIYA